MPAEWPCDFSQPSASTAAAGCCLYNSRQNPAKIWPGQARLREPCFHRKSIAQPSSIVVRISCSSVTRLDRPAAAEEELVGDWAKRRANQSLVLYVSPRLKVKFSIVLYSQNSVWKWIPWHYKVGCNGAILVKLFPSTQVVTVSKLLLGRTAGL